MALKIESKIESAWISVLEANPYIISNSIPVRKWRDNSKQKAGECVVVHVNLVNNLFGNTRSSLWSSDVEIIVITHNNDDKDGEILQAIYEEMLSEVTDVEMSTLTTSGGIDFKGVVVNAGGEANDEIYQRMIINCTCHVQS